MSGTLLILGWYGVEQRRLDFVRLLSAGLGVRKSQALDVLNASLEESVPVPLLVPDVGLAHHLGGQLAACGCEIRVIVGDANEAETPAARTYQAVRNELQAVLYSTLTRAALEATVSKMFPELQPRQG